MTALNKSAGAGVDDRRSTVIAKQPSVFLIQLKTLSRRAALLLTLPPVQTVVEVFALHFRLVHAHTVLLVDTAMTASRCGSKYWAVWSRTSRNFMEYTPFDSTIGVLQ